MCVSCRTNTEQVQTGWLVDVPRGGFSVDGNVSQSVAVAVAGTGWAIRLLSKVERDTTKTHTHTQTPELPLSFSVCPSLCLFQNDFEAITAPIHM